MVFFIPWVWTWLSYIIANVFLLLSSIICQFKCLSRAVCVGICPCTGQMVCKFSFVVSVDVLQNAAFLFFLLKYCAKNTSAGLN